MNDQHFDADILLEGTANLFTILIHFILAGYEDVLWAAINVC
jgi:hypothetical protein